MCSTYLREVSSCMRDPQSTVVVGHRYLPNIGVFTHGRPSEVHSSGSKQRSSGRAEFDHTQCQLWPIFPQVEISSTYSDKFLLSTASAFGAFAVRRGFELHGCSCSLVKASTQRALRLACVLFVSFCLPPTQLTAAHSRVFHGFIFFLHGRRVFFPGINRPFFPFSSLVPLPRRPASESV